MALFRARSSILGSFALSVSSDAARFRVKRNSGEFGVGSSVSFSGSLCLNELRRLESDEMLKGDRGASEKGRPPSAGAVGVIMILLIHLPNLWKDGVGEIQDLKKKRMKTG